MQTLIVPIHTRNLRFLAVEMFKVVKGHAPKILHQQSLMIYSL